MMTNLLLLCVLFTQTLLILALIRINNKQEKIMATQADLDAALDKLTTAVSDAAARVSADLAALNAKIAALPGAPDLSAEVAKVQSGIDAIAAIDPASPTPIAAPNPPDQSPTP